MFQANPRFQKDTLAHYDAAHINLERLISLKRIELHLKVLKKMPGVIIAILFCFNVLSFNVVSLNKLIILNIICILIEAFRFSYINNIHHQKFKLNSAQVTKKLYVLSFLSALSLMGYVLFLPYVPLYGQLMIVLIAFSIPSMFITAALLPVLIIYQCLMIIPLTWMTATLYPEQIITVAIMNLVYMIFSLNLFIDRDKLFQFSIAMHLDSHYILESFELKNAEIEKSIAKAEEASKARARVLAAASHDLRQPLQALSIYSAVLQSSPPPEALPEVADNIDRLVRVLGSLLHGLLDLSRLSNEYYVPERQRISLDRLAAEICQEFTQQAQDKQIKLVQSLTHVRLLDDKMGISRIIRNLLDNAIKYTDHGEVRISTYFKGGFAVLTVSDTGKGIPNEEKQRIYEEFYQLNNPGRNLDKGIGLGLTIVHRLCELIGIQIQLDSELGHGSSFKLIFHSVLQDSMEKPITTSINKSELVAKRIYVVDDELDIVHSLRSLLQNWQMQVETATSGSGLYKLFERDGNPDMLMIDLRLGDEHGATLAKELLGRYGQFPVLVMTGETSTSLLQESHLYGFQVLQKPITSELLQEVITTNLGSPQREHKRIH